MAQTAKTSPGSGSVPATSLAPPPNDNFADAYAATATGLQTLSTTIDATPQTGEPVVPASCATGDSNQSVWFKFTGAGTPVTVDTDGSVVAEPGAEGQFTDTIMSVYTGASLAALTIVGCNDDDPTNTLPGDFTSRINNLATVAGTTYYVRVSSYGTAANASRFNGEARLTITGVIQTAGEGTADNARSALSTSPNPILGAARVRFTTAQAQEVSVSVFDVTGREVASLFRGLVAAGQEQAFEFSSSSLPAGVYVVRALGSTVNLAQRVTVVR